MPETPFDPNRSIYPELNAAGLVNFLLERVMGDCQFGRYPNEDEVHNLAPSLKTLIMKQIENSTLSMCVHAESNMDDMACDVKDLLPPEELAALQDAMGVTPWTADSA